jgi:hypothetical protein
VWNNSQLAFKTCQCDRTTNVHHYIAWRLISRHLDRSAGSGFLSLHIGDLDMAVDDESYDDEMYEFTHDRHHVNHTNHGHNLTMCLFHDVINWAMWNWKVVRELHPPKNDFRAQLFYRMLHVPDVRQKLHWMYRSDYVAIMPNFFIVFRVSPTQITTIMNN